MKTPSPHDDEMKVICPHCDIPLNVIHDRNIQVAPYMAHTICVRTKKKTEIHCLQNEREFLKTLSPYGAEYKLGNGVRQADEYPSYNRILKRIKEISARLTQLGGSS